MTMSLEERHAILDPRIDALSEADVYKCLELLGVKARTYHDPWALLKLEHPDDQEEALNSLL